MSKLRLYSLLLFLVVFCLLFMGIMAIYSTTYTTDDDYYLKHQMIWILVGICASATIAKIPMDVLSKYSRRLLLGIMFLLVYLLIATILRYRLHFGFRLPCVVYAKGASRWIGKFGISVQPSEFAKFALILFLSSYYGMRDVQKIEDVREGLAKPLGASLCVLALIVFGKALSNTILCTIIVISIMFLAGVPFKRLAKTIGILVLCAGVLAIAEPYRRRRITNFIARRQETVEWTTAPRKDDNHQLERSICAIGSGGLSGLGVTRGRLKNKAIPESKTDFIFAVIGEEMGFCGVCLGFVLYLAFMVLCFLIGNECKDRRGMLICMSVGIIIASQAAMNLAVICGIMPTTGVTAPLVSYGGSSIVSVMMCVGLVFNASFSKLSEQNREVVLNV